MKYRVTIKICNGETECGPYRIEVTVDESIAAHVVFSAIDDRMTVMLRDLEETYGKSFMENIKIVAEMDNVDGDGWETLTPISPTRRRKTLTYHEFKMIMRREREMEQRGDL